MIMQCRQERGAVGGQEDALAGCLDGVRRAKVGVIP